MGVAVEKLVIMAVAIFAGNRAKRVEVATLLGIV